MITELEKILRNVAQEAVCIIPRWQLTYAAGYEIAAPVMFDKIFQCWNDLKDKKKYDLGENSTLTLSESTNSNNRVYILMRKEQIVEVKAPNSH